jgi:hypothetical protein
MIEIPDRLECTRDTVEFAKALNAKMQADPSKAEDLLAWVLCNLKRRWSNEGYQQAEAKYATKS